jgi:hypothetical protein
VQRPKGSQPSTDSLAWTAPTAPARANITAIFRGEQVTLNGSTSAPLLFLGKHMAPVEIRLSSAPLNMEFGGSASLGPELLRCRAHLRLSSASVRRALEWSGADIKPGEALGALELTAQLSAEPTRAKLDDLIILIDRQPRHRRARHGIARRCAAADRRHSGVQQRSTSPPSCRRSHRCPRPARTSPRPSTRASSARSGWICGCRRNRPVSDRWRCPTLPPRPGSTRGAPISMSATPPPMAAA